MVLLRIEVSYFSDSLDWQQFDRGAKHKHHALLKYFWIGWISKITVGTNSLMIPVSTLPTLDKINSILATRPQK